MIRQYCRMLRRLLIAAPLVALLAALPGAAVANGGGEKKSGGGTYLPVDTLLGTTIRANGSRGVLSVDYGLDVPDATLRTYAEQSIPRLRAAYLQTVQSYAASLSASTLPNAEYIAQSLQRQTDSVLGKPGAKLLLGAIIAN